ncbi:unnamed protein product [Prunus armeniaca]
MEFFAVCLTDFCLLLVENDIHKKLDLGPNTINVHQALNILARFCGLHWLLSEHRKEADGLPPTEDVERWELHGSDLDDLLVEREKSSTKLPHSSTSKSSIRGIKRLVSMNSKKINGMQEVRDFCSGIRSNFLKPMIYPVMRLLRSRV